MGPSVRRGPGPSRLQQPMSDDLPNDLPTDSRDGLANARSFRAAQRADLRRLIEIAETQPAHDRRAAATLVETTRVADREYSRAEAGASAKYGKQRGDAQEVHDAALSEAAAARDQKLERLSREMDAARKSVSTQHKKLDSQLKKDKHDAEWLAGITRDADRGRADQAFDEIANGIKADREDLENAEDSVAARAARYRRPFEEIVPAALVTSADAAPAKAAALLAARRFRSLLLPRLFAGATPWIVLLFALIGGAVAGQHWLGPPTGGLAWPPDWKSVAIGAAVALAVAIALGALLFSFARKKVALRLQAARQALARAYGGLAARKSDASGIREVAYAEAEQMYRLELKAAHAEFDPKLLKAASDRDSMLAGAQAKATTKRQKIESDYAEAENEAKGVFAAESARIDAQEEAELAPARTTRDKAIAAAMKHREQIAADTADRSREAAALAATLAKTPAGAVPFGSLQFDPLAFDTDSAGLPAAFKVPAMLALPDEANLLIRHAADGRDAAVQLLRTVILRLIEQLPPGRANFTFIDPIGLGREFAGFMHLADYDEALVGGRVLTEAEAIGQRLADLTEHMETVIQKYLRNEFATIDDYNAQAGELAEPYRFVVVADLPAGFGEESLRRLASIAASGPRCGVHVLVAQDTRKDVAGGGSYLDDVSRHCDTLMIEDGRIQWRDDTFGRVELTVDVAPSERQMTELVHKVGAAAREAKRVELAFEPMMPNEGEIWSLNSARDLQVPVGRTGAARMQSFKLGRGVAQHALIAGKTGSGKSTLLNVLITNLALWYGPDQLELYLIDFKRGVEFKAYATHQLPHARAVAVESDREFGLSVLQRLDEELARRGDLFRAAGVQDLAGFRSAKADQAMPRVLLVVDEFHELFSDDDKLSQDAALLIDRLVRQGRAFGMHVVLGSQTVGGATGLSRATLGQIAVRVALQCSETDSRLVLGDSNAAARLLSRPGEAIYNDAGGAVENNSPFQVAWLPDPEREGALARVRNEATQRNITVPKAAVFEGSAPARLADNDELVAAQGGKPPRANVAYLGEAVAIKPPTHVTFRRQARSNLLVVGQQEESATAILATSLISLAATCQASPRMVILDGTPGDAASAGVLRRIVARLEMEADVIDYRAAGDAMADLHNELRERLDGPAAQEQPVFLVIHGLHRFRLLNREEEYSFSTPTSSGGFGSILGGDESEKTTASPQAPPQVSASKALSELLRDGPPLGIHVIATVDTLASMERRLSRDDLREFDTRVLFQMSANDSSTLIDSPAANGLGFHRALLASEERGTREKFRPYELP